MDQWDLVFKIIVIGNSSVGKSSLVYQLINGKEHTNPQYTIGVEYTSKIIKMKGRVIKLQIWDTAGQEKFKSITKTYYRGANGAIIMFDITDEASFKSIDEWIKDAREFADIDISLMVIGNKADLSSQRAIEFEKSLSFCKQREIAFCETSCKNGMNIEKSFFELSKMILNRVDVGALQLNNYKPKYMKDLSLNDGVEDDSSNKRLRKADADGSKKSYGICGGCG